MPRNIEKKARIESIDTISERAAPLPVLTTMLTDIDNGHGLRNILDKFPAKDYAAPSGEGALNFQ